MYFITCANLLRLTGSAEIALDTSKDYDTAKSHLKRALEKAPQYEVFFFFWGGGRISLNNDYAPWLEKEALAYLARLEYLQGNEVLFAHTSVTLWSGLKQRQAEALSLLKKIGSPEEMGITGKELRTYLDAYLLRGSVCT